MLLVLFLLATLLWSQAATGQPTIGGIVCPSGNNVVDVPVGTDLSSGTTYLTPGKTYSLAAGTYFINSFTQLSSGSICYIGSGTGSTEIKLGGGQLQLTDSSQLALQALTVDGSGGPSPGILLRDAGSLAGDHVLFTDFAGSTISTFGTNGVSITLTNVRVSGSKSGATAVELPRSQLPTWSDVTFSDNTGPALFLDSSTRLTITGTTKFLRNGGSAVVSTSGALTLEDAEFVGNTAPGDGGAMRMDRGTLIRVTGTLLVKDNSAGGNGGGVSAGIEERGGAILILQGPSVFTGNSAGGNGGAVFVGDGSKLEIGGPARFGQNRAGPLGGALYMTGAAEATVAAPSGSLCISGNSAETAGGGVYMNGTAQLLLNSDANVGGGNTPDGIAVGDSTTGFTCNNGGALRGEGTYFVDGPICSCPAPASAGAQVTCPTCPSGQLWLVPECACGAPCTEPCCQPDGTPSPPDRVCRGAGSRTCTNATRCDGLLTACPLATPAAADGTPCGPWHFHQTNWDERQGYDSPSATALNRPQGAAAASSHKRGNPYRYSQPHVCYGSCKAGVCFFNKPALHKCFG